MTSKPFGNLFINAGAMKAGTTWLYWAMRLHPDLHFSLEKEVHYLHRKYVGTTVLNDNHRCHQVRSEYTRELQQKDLDIETLRERVRWLSVYLRSPMDDDWYADVIRPAAGKAWSCDFSNLYAELPAWAWRDVAQSCTALRVLFLLRDPVARLWSHLKFDLKYNGLLSQLPDWSPDQVKTYMQQPHIWSNAEYGEAIRRLTGALDPAQVKFMFMPETHTDALGFLREVEVFVGLPPAQYPDWLLTQKVNQSETVRMPDFFPELFRGDIERIKDEMRACGVMPPENWA